MSATPDLPGNAKTDKYSSPEKRATPVTTGAVTKKPRTLGKKFTDFFFDEMTFKEAAAMFVADRLLPDLKDGLFNAFQGFTETIFYGRSARPTKKAGSSGTFTSYSNYSKRNEPRPSGYRSTSARVMNGFDDVTFESRQDAEAVLEEMCNMLETYKEVSIGDFYDAARVSRNGFTDNNFGWTNLTGSYVTRGRGGWVLVLPKVVELK